MMRAQDGKTPLHMATETDVAALVSALLDAGVDVNAKDKVRNAGYARAAVAQRIQGSSALRRQLTSALTTIPAAAAQNAATPLHNAAWKGHLSAVTLLLARGADKEAKTGKVRASARPFLLHPTLRSRGLRARWRGGRCIMRH